MIVAAMALAGGVGAVLRLLATLRWREGGTLGVNIVGSALLGVLVGADAGSDALLVAGTGFCGGLTTFSTYAVEVVALRRTTRRRALPYAVGTLAAAVAAGGLGLGAGALLSG